MKYIQCMYTNTLAHAHIYDSVLVFSSSLFRQISDSCNIVAEWTLATKTHYRLPSPRDYFESICSFLCCALRSACVWHLSYANDMYNLHLLHRLFLIAPLKMHILIDAHIHTCSTSTSMHLSNRIIHNCTWRWKLTL